MFKTQNLYQNDAKWKNVKLGDSMETIGGWGGLLTSITMILNGIGYDETPETVNEQMKKAGSFLTALLGPPYVALVWPNCIYRGMTRCEKSDAPLAQIDAAVAAGKPVILQVDSSKQAGMQAHFVLVKEKKGNDYTLYDPYRYDNDDPDQEVLLTSRYKYRGAKLESEISAVLWFDFYSAALPRRPKGSRVPVPTEQYPLYVAEDFLVLRASPVADSYPWKCLMTGTELTCLENKATAKAKLGKKDQWIRVQDPEGDQGYVAAWFVNSTRFPELVLPSDQALPSRKKWCLNNVEVENPQLESWVETRDGKKTLLPYHQPIKSFDTLPINTVVNVLKPKQTIPGDAESSWSGIAYQETYYDTRAKKFVTTRVTGWINDDDLDDYNEHPDERFRESVVDILYATQMTTDAAQYMTVEADDVYDPSKVKHNLCGEFCVAYILGQSINQVLDKWKVSSRATYDSRVGKADLPLEGPHMENLITVHLGLIEHGNWARYKLLDQDNKLVSYKPLAFADPDPRRTDQRRASDDFRNQLRDFYFITTVKINLDTGDLAKARSVGEGNHWVVLDKITRDGGRVELYNPFPNKRQEYTFSEFYRSIGGDPNTGWWVKREVNPTFAKQRDRNNEPAFEPPIFQVAIEDENKTPDLKDAEQYIKVEGLKKTNLCGEFSVSFILTQSMENTLRRWIENQESLKAQGKPPKLSELVTGLQAYGLIDGKTMPDQNKKITTFTIDRVLQFWKAVQPDLFNSILGDGNNEKTGPTELKTILEAYGYKKRVDFSDGGLLSSPGRTAEKLKTHFLICGVTIDGSKAGRLGGSIPHWIVVDKITPIGNLVGGNGGWVELYNPFLNRWEEYSYREFLAAYNGGGLWVSRDITPGFAPQYRIGAMSKSKDSKKDAQFGSKKENAKRRRKSAQNELVQNSLNQSPSDDVEALLRERFKVDTFPPEIVQWIGEQARGSELLADGLMGLLLDFGLISIDAENKKCKSIDFNDTSLAHKIENALHLGMNGSNAASQQSFKTINAIGTAVASMAIEGIKNVRATIAAEELEKKAY